MFRRTIWFATGVSAGFAGATFVRRKVRRQIDRVMPGRLRADVSASARRFGHDVRAAVHEGRTAMRDRETELRAELSPGSPSRR